MEEGGGKWWGHEVECLELQFLEEGMEIRDRDCSRERAMSPLTLTISVTSLAIGGPGPGGGEADASHPSIPWPTFCCFGWLGQTDNSGL